MSSLYKTLVKNVVDSTAMAAVCNPILAFFGNVILGFSDELTLGSRISGTLLQYLGIGFAYTKGRECLHHILKIDHKSRRERWYDVFYGGVFSATISAGIFAANGATLEEIAYGSMTHAGLGLVMGMPAGYAVDVFRDLTGIEQSVRTPSYVRCFGRRAKLAVAAAAVAVSVGLVGATLAATPDTFHGAKGYLEDAVNDAFK